MADLRVFLVRVVVVVLVVVERGLLMASLAASLARLMSPPALRSVLVDEPLVSMRPLSLGLLPSVLLPPGVPVVPGAPVLPVTPLALSLGLPAPGVSGLVPCEVRLVVLEVEPFSDEEQKLEQPPFDGPEMKYRFARALERETGASIIGYRL